MPGLRWQINCPLGDKSRSKTITPCESCVVRLECGCELDAPGEFRIPLQINGCGLDSLVKGGLPLESHVTLEPINIASLTFQGFDPNQVGQIKGSDLKTFDFASDFVSEIQTKEFSWNETIEISEKYKSDLKYYLELSKQNMSVFKTKSDFLLAKANDLTSIQISKAEQIESIFTDFSWITDIGGIFGPTGTAITSVFLPIVSLCISMYACCKLNSR